MSTGRSIHAVPSITPSPREGIKDGPRLRAERVPIALAEGRPEDPRAKASAEVDVAGVTVEGSPQIGPERPRAPHQAALSRLPPLSGGDEGR